MGQRQGIVKAGTFGSNFIRLIQPLAPLDIVRKAFCAWGNRVPIDRLRSTEGKQRSDGARSFIISRKPEVNRSRSLHVVRVFGVVSRMDDRFSITTSQLP